MTNSPQSCSAESCDLKPCPFCGTEATIQRRMDEDLWTHNIVEWVGVHCDECGIYFEQPVTSDTTAADAWNKRACEIERERALITDDAQPVGMDWKLSEETKQAIAEIDRDIREAPANIASHSRLSADIVGLNRGVQTAYGIARDILRPSPCPQEAHDPCVWPRCDCAPRTLNEPQAAPVTETCADCGQPIGTNDKCFSCFEDSSHPLGLEAMIGRPYGQEKADVACLAPESCRWPTCECGRDA